MHVYGNPKGILRLDQILVCLFACVVTQILLSLLCLTSYVFNDLVTHAKYGLYKSCSQMIRNPHYETCSFQHFPSFNGDIASDSGAWGHMLFAKSCDVNV